MKIFNIFALSLSMSTFIACSKSDSNSSAGPVRPNKEAILGSEAYKNLQGTWESQNPKSKLEFTSDVAMKVSFIDACAVGETLSTTSSISSVSDSRVEIPSAKILSKQDEECGFEISSFDYTLNGKNLVIETEDGDINYVLTSKPVVVVTPPSTPSTPVKPVPTSITTNGGQCSDKEKADSELVFNQAMALAQKLEASQSISKAEVATFKSSSSSFIAKYKGLNCKYSEAGDENEIVLDEASISEMNSFISILEQIAE
jgi:hypothetical protein